MIFYSVFYPANREEEVPCLVVQYWSGLIGVHLLVVRESLTGGYVYVTTTTQITFFLVGSGSFAISEVFLKDLLSLATRLSQWSPVKLIFRMIQIHLNLSGRSRQISLAWVVHLIVHERANVGSNCTPLATQSTAWDWTQSITSSGYDTWYQSLRTGVHTLLEFCIYMMSSRGWW